MNKRSRFRHSHMAFVCCKKGTDGKEAFATSTSVPSSGYSSTNSYSFRYEDSSTYTNTKSTTRTSGSQDISATKFSTRQRKIYAYSDICSATNNFLLKPLSSSSSSKAWRCSIHRKDIVVIQRKLHNSVDMSQIEDRLSTFYKSYHDSVIRLLGASISGDRIFLVYDYMTGISLADYLRSPNPNKPSSTLPWWSWVSRMQIATDIAQGLEYIHHYVKSDKSIVHNHLKSTSVIVTMPLFNAKICHFGTAELSGKFSGDKIREARIEGRRGYMAPETIARGIVSQKSDVFSYGVVLLEILSGKEPVEEIYDEDSGDYWKISLIDSARDAIEPIEMAKIRKWIDRRLKDSFPIEVAEKMMRVGLECVQVEPDERPDMRRVAGKILKMYWDSREWYSGTCMHMQRIAR